MLLKTFILLGAISEVTHNCSDVTFCGAQWWVSPYFTLNMNTKND